MSDQHNPSSSSSEASDSLEGFAHLRERFRYRSDIDGLRAVAVIPVVLFHAGMGFPGGFVGVDIFFVISGYLITSLIIREMLAGTFTLKNFWERRVRRIFPASVVVTVLTVLAGAWVLLPDTYRDLGKAGVAQVTMVANFYFWKQDGYFAGPSDLEPLLHMWSLAVEEQFYFLFPLLLLALAKRGERRTFQILILLFVASLCWSIFTIDLFKKATFYLLPARAWELLAGALLALAPLPSLKTDWIRQLLALAGMALIAFAVATYSLDTTFPGLTAIPPCLGAVLVILAGSGGTTVVGRLLSLPPMVFVGKISYSLYLWHWPLLVYARHLSLHEVGLTTRVLLVVASFVLATLTWRFVENPFRKRQLMSTQPQIFRFLGWSTGVLALAFATLYWVDGLAFRFKGADARYTEAFNERPAVHKLKEDFSEFPLLRPEAEVEPLPFLVWGDSHARCMVTMFHDLCEEMGINGYHACRPSAAPLLGVNRLPDDDTMAPHNDMVLAAIDHHQIKRVFLIARWTYYLKVGHDSQVAPLTDRDRTGRPSEVVFEESLTRTIAEMRKRGIEVVIMRQVPLQHRSPAVTLWLSQRFGHDPATLGVTVPVHEKHQRDANRIIDSLAQPGVRILDPLPLLLQENGHTKVEELGEILYSDSHHLRHPGAMLLKPLFTPYLNLDIPLDQVAK